ncbi:formylglycine-generating enzyme required for sulfatase activity [Rhodobium gokarnense]|uniref:Formylglycine-generating enzyme required for sulfatase activity n=1 Tax=Rhodobium gokarnense TaxID=364296 RepID=A0ABT3HF26_9HYPH|nr:formylglycine-generating enzyme required for sulfatase activity [Rhodobium gokarnense]
MTWYDAVAYATWAGLRLPSEAEWERAAQGGLVNNKFHWGMKRVPGRFAMNTWQGHFPDENTAEDEHVGTAPVDVYEPNAFGMYNMTGNVWEWVQDYFRDGPSPNTRIEVDPTGLETGLARVQRGGSFLCHESYCDRYYVHSRTRGESDSSSSNSDFRVAADIET